MVFYDNNNDDDDDDCVKNKEAVITIRILRSMGRQ